DRAVNALRDEVRVGERTGRYRAANGRVVGRRLLSPIVEHRVCSRAGRAATDDCADRRSLVVQPRAVQFQVAVVLVVFTAEQKMPMLQNILAEAYSNTGVLGVAELARASLRHSFQAGEILIQD